MGYRQCSIDESSLARIFKHITSTQDVCHFPQRPEQMVLTCRLVMQGTRRRVDDHPISGPNMVYQALLRFEWYDKAPVNGIPIENARVGGGDNSLYPCFLQGEWRMLPG